MSSNITNSLKECVLTSDEPLAKHTSFRIGGNARYFVVPQTRDSLVIAARSFAEREIPYRILGKGSNVLVRDEGFDGAILVTTALTRLQYQGPQILAEAGVPFQNLIRFGMAHEVGGIEYLQSVPGTVGGGVYMNAGRGRNLNRSLGDHVLAVEVFDGERTFWLPASECGFEYRRSTFHDHPEWHILSAAFSFPAQDPQLTQQLVQERMALTKQTQDTQYPNVGSVFKDRFHGFEEFKGYRIGGAQFSTKTLNWILNVDQAKAVDVLALIAYAQDFHEERGMARPVLEIEII